jgi:hypothetical protein
LSLLEKNTITFGKSTLVCFKSKSVSLIDEAIEKSCDFKLYVMQVLEKKIELLLLKQIQIMKLGFRLNPIELYVTDAVQNLNCDGGLKM